MNNRSENKEAIVAVGAGRMGRGIAHIFAYSGHPVVLLDVKKRSEDDFAKLSATAYAEISRNLQLLVSLDVLNNSQLEQIVELIQVRPLSAAEEVLAAADVVIEGVPETAEAKASALALVGDYASVETPVLSTTSSMLVTELQKCISHPQRFLNAHFLNPAFLIPLVEISPGADTSEDIIRRVVELLENAGKTPVRCSASPGYIVPRLQALIMSEACRMVHEGVASAEEIDKAIRQGFGPRYTTMGVLEFIDYGGLDTHFYASHRLAGSLNSPAHAAPPELDEMMARGETGMHAGRGYYDYKNTDIEHYQNQKLSSFVSLFKQLGHIPKPGV